MNRTHWKFSYPADKLLAAATAKHSWHTARLKWWTDKQKEIKEKIKAEGIEIDESVAFDPQGAHTHSYNSSFRGPAVSIRDDLVRDLTECNGKMHEHRTKINDYDAWMQVLASQGQTAFELNQDDWLFFYGK